MATLELDRREGPARADLVRSALLVLGLGFLACYAFFTALGGVSPAEVLGVTAAAVVVLGLWLAHLVRERGQTGDPMARVVRERRGF